MPWDSESFGKHYPHLTAAQKEKGAKQASAILAKCLAEGKDAKECEGMALATAAKSVQEEASTETTTDTKVVLENGMDVGVCCPAWYCMPESVQKMWKEAWNASWKKNKGLSDQPRVMQANADADASVRTAGWLVVNGKWSEVSEQANTETASTESAKPSKKAAKSDGETNFVEVMEAYGSSGVRVDRDAGVINNVMIFGPPRDPDTGHFKSDRGAYYNGNGSYHKSVAESVAGALGWTNHPEEIGKEKWKMRDPSAARSKVLKCWVAEEGGIPVVRGNVKPIGKKADREAYFDLIDDAGDRIGFSLFAKENFYRRDPVHLVDVIESIHTKCKWKPSVDLVECSGATKSVFENADTGGKQSKQNEEENNMDAKEMQKLIDDGVAAALKKHVEEAGKTDKAADEAKLKEVAEAARAAVMKELQPTIDAAKKSADDAELRKKQAAVRSVIESAKIDPDDRSKALVSSVESAYPDEKKMDEVIQDHKTMLAKHVKPVKEAGSETNVAGSDPNRPIELKAVVETCEARGFSEMVGSICAVAETGSAREAAIEDKWNKSRLADIINPRIQSPEMRKLRTSVVESWSPRRICTALLGHDLNSDSRVGLKQVQEAALDSTMFSTINNAVLSAHVIERYEINKQAAANGGFGLIAAQLTKLLVSDKESETYAGYTAPGVMADVNQLAAPLEAVMDEKFVTDPATKPRKRAVYVAISREEVYFDKPGQVLERANAVADHGAVDEEKADLNGIFELGGVRSYRPAGSQENLFSDAHNNLLGTNTMANIGNIQAALKVLRGFTDENGDILLENAMPPLLFVVPNALWDFANDLIKADRYERRRPTGTSDEVMHIANGYRNSIVLGSPYLDASSETTWYVGSQRGWQKQYTRKRLFPFEVVQVPQAEIQGVLKDAVAGVKVQWWGWIVARDYRYVIKCVTAAC